MSCPQGAGSQARPSPHRRLDTPPAPQAAQDAQRALDPLCFTVFLRHLQKALARLRCSLAPEDTWCSWP